MTKAERERFDFMKAMHTIVMSFNDETPYFNNWIYLVPDEASDEDLMDIALDDGALDEVTTCFCKLIRLYGKDGFCFGDGHVFG